MKPTRYAKIDNSTFLQVLDYIVTIRYDVKEVKKYGIIPQSSMAIVSISINEGLEEVSFEYSVTRGYRVGKEIDSVERGLYDLIDNTLRTIFQLRVSEVVDKEVRLLEDEVVFSNLKDMREYLRNVDDPNKDDKAQLYAALHEFTDRLLKSITYVTKVTSLNRADFEAYQGQQSASLDVVVSSQQVTPSSGSIIESVIRYLDSNTTTDTYPEIVYDRTLDYLIRSEQRSGNGMMTAQRAAIILDEFVPRYLEIRRERDAAVRVPTYILNHSFESFFEGGIKGWIGLSLIGEVGINYIFGTNLDIPGWYIGAGLEFFWPYLKALYGVATRDRKFRRDFNDLFESIQHRLDIAPSESRENFLQFIQEKREETRKALESRKAEIERRKKRASEIGDFIPKIAELYTRMKTEYDDGNDVAHAVSITSNALIETNLPVQDVFRIIRKLKYGESNINELANGVNKVIRVAGSQPHYNLERVLETIEIARQNAVDFDDSENIAEVVVTMLKIESI